MNSPSLPGPVDGSNPHAACAIFARPAVPYCALLVGVESHAPGSGLRPLQGCRNDVGALAAFFSHALNVPRERLITLTDAQATAGGLFDALERLLALSDKSGVDSASRPQLWVHFAGYGSLAPAAEGRLEPSLVLWESRAPGGRDLLLSELIARLNAAAAERDILLLLDCGFRAAAGATTRNAHTPAVRAVAPSQRASPAYGPTLLGSSRGANLSVLAAALPGAYAFETPLYDLEGRLWRGGLTLAVEEYLRACLPALLVGAQCDLTTPPAVEMARRLNEQGIEQRPNLAGNDRLLRAARKQAAALAPPLQIDAEEAGLFWVNGGLVHGLRVGCRLQARDGEGAPATFEAVEVGFDRSGCAPLHEVAALELPVAAMPVAAAPLRQGGRVRSGVGGHATGVRLSTATLELPVGASARLEAAPARPRPRSDRAALDDLLPDPAPEGLEAWPDEFAPVLPPDAVGGPVRLALSGAGSRPLAVAPAMPLRLTCTLQVPVAVREPRALLALASDGDDFWPVARARLSPRPPLADAQPEASRGVRVRLSLAGPQPVEHTVTLELNRVAALSPVADATGAGVAVVPLSLYTVAGQDTPPPDLYQVRRLPQAWAAGAAPASFVRAVAGGEMHYTPALPARPNERVALLLHGFGDDSAGMAEWMLGPLREAGIDYDRVLAFEYESLGAGLRGHAGRLACALQALGFGAGTRGQGPEVHLFGHGAGVLVGRWFVEQLGGDCVVDRLVAFGAPNLGTPLAQAGLLGSWMVAAALNMVRPSFPAPVGAWALGRLPLAADTEPKLQPDLHPDSEWLTALNRSSPPGRTRILAVAGNAAPTADGSAENRQAARLLMKLAGGAQVAAALFQGEPNDGVVTLRSALAFRAGRSPGSTVRSLVAPVHHLGYFTSPFVTDHVAQWLREEEEPVG